LGAYPVFSIVEETLSASSNNPSFIRYVIIMWKVSTEGIRPLAEIEAYRSLASSIHLVLNISAIIIL
jgi:hypothetical protein